MKKDSKNNLLAFSTIATIAFATFIVVTTAIKDIRRSRMTDKQIFTEIYDTQGWGGWNGVGPGSTEEDGARPFLDYLQSFIDLHDDIKTVVDMGCGYGELLKNIKFPKDTKYLGLDIVESVIKFNKEHYVRDNFSFDTVEKLEDLATYHGDLLMLKDVIQHWTIDQILFAKKHIIPNFKYAIIVNNIYTVYPTVQNSAIRTGDSRPLDLKKAPFFMNPEHVEDYKLPPYRIKRIHLFVNKKDDNF